MSILQTWTDHLKNYVCDQRGVVAVIFGIAAIPIVGMVGASLDYSRAANVQSQLQDALDGAILTAAHEQQLSDTQLEAAIRAQIEAMVSGAHGADALTLSIMRDPDEDTLMEISATMKVDTTILEIMGINEIEVGANAAVSLDFRALEVALVLDNTGSMRHQNRIVSLREAALDFVEIVSDDGNAESLRISLVPYSAQVNIGNTVTMEQYLDKQGLSEHHASLIEGQVVARSTSRNCRNARVSSLDHPLDAQPAENPVEFAEREVPAPSPAVPGFARLDFFDLYGDVLQELIGVNAAHAATVDPYEPEVRGCFMYNPDRISHWQLYQQLDDVEWKGCVEARPEPYDVTDTPPDAGNPDTLWVPAFWLDDSGRHRSNDWLSDRQPSGYSFYDEGAIFSIYKYSSSSGHRVDNVPSYTLGPAQNCGHPIIPLTDNFDMLNDRIEAMTYWLGGGTVTSQGVIWGWRALSPAQPFTEGVPYGEATKVMVVMTDGRNELVSSPENALRSHYSAYGYLTTGRFPQASVGSARHYIDGRTLAACENAKNAGILVYTVTFGLDGSTRRMWDECASEPSMAHHVNSSTELVGAFSEIADSIGELRLTR
ncbi:MAG: pilus assembly protein TadG-related protein [Hyphomicrobiales bacterium]